MSGISILRRLLMKKAMKENAPFQHEGIMSISRSLSGNVDAQVKKWVKSAKRQGQDIDKMSEQELKYLIELNKPRPPKVYSNEEAYEFLNRFLNQNKRGEVIKADFGKPFKEEIGSVDNVVNDITRMEPIAAMKEVNKVLRREGKYKNLSKQDSEKVFNDTNDWINQRDPSDLYDYKNKRPFREDPNFDPDDPDFDPENFAGGGIAGMLGEPTYQDDNHRVPFKDAKSVQGPSMGPQNIYDIGFGSILEDVMSDSPKRKYTEKDLENIWNILQGDQDMDIEDLMFRFGRVNPDKKSNLFFELGKDKAGIGWKKQFNEGGRVPLSFGGWLMKLLQGGSKAKPFNVKDFMDKREFILSLIGQGSKQKNKRILNEILEESGKIRKNPSFKFPDTDEIKKKIWKDITKDITKHADGGRVPLAGGKLVKDLGLKFLNKVFSKDRMKEMRTQDPELYQGLLEVVDKFRARDKTGLIKYMKKYLPHMDDAEIEDFITASDTGDIYGQLIRLGSGRDYKGKMEMIEKLEKANMLKDFDVGKATKHATGGRVPFKKGKLALLQGLGKIMDEFFPGTTKLGQRSKPFPEKVQEKMDLRKAFADFQKREKAAKFKDMIKNKYQGRIDDDLLNKMLVDDNPQRIAEVMATIDEALIMQGKGIGPETIMTTLRDSWKRKKNASGGLAGMLGE